MLKHQKILVGSVEVQCTTLLPRELYITSSEVMAGPESFFSVFHLKLLINLPPPDKYGIAIIDFSLIIEFLTPRTLDDLIEH